MALPNFSNVGQSAGQAAQGMAPQMPQQPQPQQADALTPLFQALAQAMAAQSKVAGGRLQLQGQQTFGRHLGTGGGEVTPQNPSGNLSNPWDPQGLFHGGFGGQLTPEGNLASQGGSAMAQRGTLGQVQGVDPTRLKQAQGQQTPQPGGAYSSSPSIDQFSDPFFIRRQQADPYSSMFQSRDFPGQQMQGGMGQSPMQKKRPGSSFNFMGGGSPRPGFGFGAGM